MFLKLNYYLIVFNYYFLSNILCMNLRIKKEAVSSSRTWTNAIIPYKIDDRFNDFQKKVIELAIKEYEMKTCLKFPKYKSEDPYLNFELNDVDVICASQVGINKYTTNMYVILTKECVTLPVVLHEIAHAIGFYHQHSAKNRDEFIKVVDEKNNGLKKLPENLAKSILGPYCLYSVTHYPLHKDRKHLMDLIGNPVNIDGEPIVEERIGKMEVLSDCEIRKIKKLYNCSDLTALITEVSEKQHYAKSRKQLEEDSLNRSNSEFKSYEWKFKFEEKNRIKLNFEAKLPDNCTYCKLSIIDGFSSDSKRYDYCTTDHLTSFISTSNTLIIKFICKFDYLFEFEWSLIDDEINKNEDKNESNLINFYNYFKKIM